MDLATVPVDFWITIATMLATLIIGELSKKFTKINSKRIPIQNLLIGVIVCGIEYLITRDFNSAVAISGIFSGGVYDIAKSVSLVLKEDKEEK